jgi:hypothetical protein
MHASRDIKAAGQEKVMSNSIKEFDITFSSAMARKSRVEKNNFYQYAEFLN